MSKNSFKEAWRIYRFKAAVLNNNPKKIEKIIQRGFIEDALHFDSMLDLDRAPFMTYACHIAAKQGNVEGDKDIDDPLGKMSKIGKGLCLI